MYCGIVFDVQLLPNLFDPKVPLVKTNVLYFFFANFVVLKINIHTFFFSLQFDLISPSSLDLLIGQMSPSWDLARMGFDKLQQVVQKLDRRQWMKCRELIDNNNSESWDASDVYYHVLYAFICLSVVVSSMIFPDNL